MNKKILAFLVFIILIIGIFSFFNTDNKKENKEIKIGVLQLLSHPALDDIYKGFKDEISKSKYKDALIDFQNAQGDQSNLASMSQKLVEEKNDIILAITTPSALSLANTTKEIPIVLAGITYPVEAGLIKSEEKPETNISGISDRIDISKQFDLIKEVLPEIKTIGLLYTASEDNSVKQIEEAKNIAKSLGIEIKLASISNTNDIRQVAENLASSVDAIFIPIDNTLASLMPTISKISLEYKVPVFPSADTMVKDGGLLGLGINQYSIGVQSAKVLINVLNGEDIKNIPISIAKEVDIYINSKIAKDLGIEFPEKILKQAIDVSK